MKNGWDFYRDVWQPAACAVSNMEAQGLQLDIEMCRARAAECVAKQQEIGEQLNEWAGKKISWNSPKQKAEFFYDTMGWPVPPVCGNVRAIKRTKAGQRPTDEAAVIHLARSAPGSTDRHLLRLYCGYPDIKAKEHELSWKQAAKLQGFYQALPAHAEVDGRVHTQLAALTRTGRLTSRNPNLQQIAPVVRDVFKARDGHVLIETDYASLEWRALGHIVAKRYEDFSLVNEIREGIDPHQATAEGMTKRLGRSVTRAAAKILNYSVNYKKTAAGLAIQLEIPESEAEALLDAFFEARPGIAQWHRDAWDYVKTRGYCRTLLGRFLPIPEVTGDRFKRQQAERKSVSFPIQGTAADIASLAMVGCSEIFNSKLRGMGVTLLLQVHDSLLHECPEGAVAEAKAEIEARMVHCLKGCAEFLCPLAVSMSTGKTWGECASKG